MFLNGYILSGFRLWIDGKKLARKKLNSRRWQEEVVGAMIRSHQGFVR
jgi:hypothetical protein